MYQGARKTGTRGPEKINKGYEFEKGLKATEIDNGTHKTFNEQADLSCCWFFGCKSSFCLILPAFAFRVASAELGFTGESRTQAGRSFFPCRLWFAHWVGGERNLGISLRAEPSSQ
ncbi:hypothetical protein HWI79_956 [Cryptosporidium felis]|nr:hypothetical protein HWI79_956 [Cryptosporidium felis]